MNPIAYYLAIFPALRAGGYSFPFTFQTASGVEADGYKQGLLDFYRTRPCPDLAGLVIQRWAYRPLTGWTDEGAVKVDL